jgi:hypothetical protein
MVKEDNEIYYVSWVNVFLLVFGIIIPWVSGFYNVYIKWLFN